MKKKINSKITRRGFLKAGAIASAIPFLNITNLKGVNFDSIPKKKKKSKRILHITDVHIRPNRFFQAGTRCEKILNKIFTNENNEIDLVLNGGDSIWAADYRRKDMTKEYTLEQWDVWDKSVVGTIRKYYKGEILSTLGNHDMWWGGIEGAKNKNDEVYGKDYVVKRFGIENRYYSREFFGWKFIVLDCNNSGILDKKQFDWYNCQPKKTPKDQHVIVLSHQPIAFVSQIISRGLNERMREIIMKPWLNTKSINPRKVHFVSGHEHILDSVFFNNIGLHCNGALSGTWWNYEIEQKNGSYAGTPMGYALIDIDEDGSFDCNYYDATDVRDGKLL